MEYIELILMDCSVQQKLGFSDYYTHNTILCDTWYISYKIKLKSYVFILHVEKYRNTLDLTERIMKDLHTSFHCKHQLTKKLTHSPTHSWS
jgi:hypothetical protein